MQEGALSKREVSSYRGRELREDPGEWEERKVGVGD
jgi:hypothetical protein